MWINFRKLVSLLLLLSLVLSWPVMSQASSSTTTLQTLLESFKQKYLLLKMEYDSLEKSYRLLNNNSEQFNQLLTEYKLDLESLDQTINLLSQQTTASVQTLERLEQLYKQLGEHLQSLEIQLNNLKTSLQALAITDTIKTVTIGVLIVTVVAETLYIILKK